MYKVRTYNQISVKGLDRFPRQSYEVGSDIGHPDAFLLRSQKLQGEPVPASLVAVARAGAGTNNVPIAEYSKQGIVVFNTPGANANAVKELVMAGMLLADSEYRHELEAQIQPFKGLLLGLFFMSVGMTANLPLLIEAPHWIILGALGLMLTKGLVLGLLGRAHGNDLATSIRLGVTLPQGGEFAFILFTSAVSLGLMSGRLGESLVLIVTLSMALTPIGFWLLERVLEPHWSQRDERKFDTLEDIPEHEVIIAGFGRVGQIIARVLRVHRIQFVALESSARQVDFVRRFGNQVFYGKLDNLALLQAAGAAKAKLLVLAIDDVEESVRTAQIIRHYFPKLPIYARARDRMHAYRLMDLGISVIHRETLGSSLEMARDVLVNIGFNQINAELSVKRFREYDDQLMIRQQAIYQNETALVESAKQAMQELEGLFESDSRAARRTTDEAENR